MVAAAAPAAAPAADHPCCQFTFNNIHSPASEFRGLRKQLRRNVLEQVVFEFAHKDCKTGFYRRRYDGWNIPDGAINGTDGVCCPWVTNDLCHKSGKDRYTRINILP
jgi:hypothetical protein